MRPLKSHCPAHALTTLDTLLKQTKAARGLRRAQAVREVVAGHHLNAISEAFHLAHAALRTWGQRFAPAGPRGLRDRPRSGRPPKVTCALAQPLNRLIAQAPLEHGSLHSQWSCRELATGLARETRVHLGRERVRGMLKKRLAAPSVPPGVLSPPPPTSRMAHSPSPPSSPGLGRMRSLCSMKTQQSCGALPCPARAGG